jgi:hypothetical protein
MIIGCPAREKRFPGSTIVINHGISQFKQKRFQGSSLSKDFVAIGLGASIADEVALTVKAGDEHGAAMHFATGLSGSRDRRLIVLGKNVTDALSETASAELVGAAEVVD